jgi:hypothetical protein
MSEKTGQRPTGRKPTNARRQSTKTAGGFGKETVNQVTSGAAQQNVDKASRPGRDAGSGGGT